MYLLFRISSSKRHHVVLAVEPLRAACILIFPFVISGSLSIMRLWIGVLGEAGTLPQVLTDLATGVFYILFLALLARSVRPSSNYGVTW